MSKRKPSFQVEEVLPNDDQLGARSIVWKTFMDAFLAALNQSAVVRCTRHLQTVIGQRCRFCFNVIMHSLQAFRRWLMLREQKGKLGPPPPEVGEPPPILPTPLDGEDSGEPQRKYNKPNEENDMVFEKVCEMLDYDASDHSNASDVQTDPEAEDENFEKDFTRADVENQLVHAVAKRKRIWAKSGLMDLMKAVEDGPNMPSHLKVEKWLFAQNAGPFDMTQNRETIVTEKTADGDSMRFYRKQEVTLSRDADDADSLSTVDEKKYILQNKKDRNVTSKIKVIQTFRIKTNSANAFALKPRLHSIGSFPIHEEEPVASTSWLHKTSRSDSAFETGEDQSQNRSREPSLRRPVVVIPHISSVLQSDRESRRKKVFKKTVKKKSALGSPSRKGTLGNSTEQYESALQRCGAVRKVAPRRIHWQELSHIAESSSDESADQVRTTRSKSKASPSKRELRSSSRSSMTTPENSPRKRSPRKKLISPRKIVDRELVGNFKSICLSPRKKLVNLQQAPRSRQPSLEQNSTNLTALFSSGNDKIANSTTVSHNTTGFSNRSMIPDATRGIVVYKPKTIQSDAAADARIRITAKDLELAKVAKERHLKGFQKFDHLIHPNSSVLFFPSDSEDDEPLATQTVTTTTTTTTDGDLSFDDDDPILTFKPRSQGRLNVMEYRYQ